MLAGYSFRPRLWALALAFAACAAGIALGNWQSGRAEEKRALGAQLERSLAGAAIELPATPIKAEDFVYKRVAARGEWLLTRSIYLDNKQRHGRVGYEVVTPLKLGPAMHVLVNRGWFERGASGLRSPEGEVRVEGIALARLPRALRLGEEAKSRVRQNLDIAEFAAETGLALQPIVIEQRSDGGDGLLREWPRPDLGVDMHASYALQWYSLAALAIVLLVLLSFRKREE